MTTYVQPIITRVDIPANVLIRNVAMASVIALQTLPSDHWQPWLDSHRFTKSVRKVKPTQVETWAESFHMALYGSAAAGVPESYDMYPKKLASARVEGWSDQVEEWNDSSLPSEADLVIHINSDLGMTAGKASAQAAHALMLWSLDAKESIVDKSVTVKKISFSSLDALPSLVVVDSGLTEIAPNSKTAFVL